MSSCHLSMRPTPRKHASSAYTRYTWPCNPEGLPPHDVTTTRRALLPHVFTLTSVTRRLFSAALSVRLPQPPISGVWRSLLPGLSSPPKRSDRTNCPSKVQIHERMKIISFRLRPKVCSAINFVL